MSENKQINFTFSSVNQTIYPESKFLETKLRNGSIITYGDNNLFPQYLNALYDNNSLHSGIINKKINYIYGDGLYSETGSAPLTAFIEKCNSKGDSLNDIYRKAVEDNERYGGFAIEVVNNRMGEMEELYYIDQSNLRISGSEENILYSKDWSNRYGKKKTLIYDSYVPGQSGSASSIFWYKGNARGYYPKPPYNGGLFGIEQLTELDKFSLATIQNGFFPGVMISMPGGNYTDEQKESIRQSILGKEGTTMAGKTLLTFPGLPEEAPLFTKIDQPDIVNQYEQQRANAIDSIFMGHQISVRNIFGIQIPGLLNDSKAYAEGTEVFQADYVTPAQKKLMAVFNRLLSIKFPKCDLAVHEIEPIGSVFENELGQIANMTQDEYRAELKRMGKIENIEIPEGAKMAILPIRGDTPISDLPVPPGETDTPLK